MPEMAAARGAHDLGAHHPVTRVRLLVDRLGGGGGVERGPAAARVVLRLGREQLGSTAGAVVDAVLERVVVLSGERALGALLAQHVVLLGAELGPPLGLCLFDVLGHAVQTPGRLNRYENGAT